jgi:sulfur dioxygenase
MIFRQLMDLESSTYTYLLADVTTREAVLIDTVFEQVNRDTALLSELGLTLKYTLDTHVHADHVSGAWLHRERSGSQIVFADVSGAEGADVYVQHGDSINIGPRRLSVRATPGHTNGCVTYVLDDETCAFTGDALLIRGAGRTDFQEGNPATLYRSVHLQLFTLPDDCQLYPGHDYRGLTSTSVGEEKSFNTRLGGERSESDFVGYMNNLGLPHPKKLAEAVPANLNCGKPVSGQTPAPCPDWAPLQLTFAGIWEIDSQILQEQQREFQVIDVREPGEFIGPLGHIKQAIPIPLGALAKQAKNLDPDKPIVTVCRAGGRSAQANVILQKAGFSCFASLAGGMLRWRSLGLAVEGGED